MKGLIGEASPQRWNITDSIGRASPLPCGPRGVILRLDTNHAASERVELRPARDIESSVRFIRDTLPPGWWQELIDFIASLVRRSREKSEAVGETVG